MNVISMLTSTAPKMEPSPTKEPTPDLVLSTIRRSTRLSCNTAILPMYVTLLTMLQH